MSERSLPDRMTEITITTPGGPEVLQSRRVPPPRPGPGEVLIQVAAVGVNRPDVMQRAGVYPMPPGVTPTPGLEVAGTILALGDGVTDHAVGDIVCALTNGGGYADYCVAPATQTLPIPPGMDMPTAAALPETFFTVWANLFAMARATRGDRVLIHGGTSGIGTTALMLCREFGIQAYATAGSAAKCDVIRDLGGIALNYRDCDFADAIHDLTAGEGVDIVLDIMGGDYFNSNVRVLARDGRLVVIGFLGGTRVDRFDLMSLVLKRGVVTGSTMRARTAAEKAAIARDLAAHVWPALAAGRCHPLIHAAFPLEQAAEAHRLMESNAHIGKIVLIP